MCQNYLAIFLSIHISFQGNQDLFESDKNVLRQTSTNEKGCSLAALGGYKPLEFFSKKKKNVIGLETSQHLIKIF